MNMTDSTDDWKLPMGQRVALAMARSAGWAHAYATSRIREAKAASGHWSDVSYYQGMRTHARLALGAIRTPLPRWTIAPADRRFRTALAARVRYGRASARGVTGAAMLERRAA
jgi:hypothetical protein